MIRRSGSCVDIKIVVVDTFKAYDKDDDGRVSRIEFNEFIRDSWMSAFRLLGEKIQKGPNPYNVNLGKVNSWA
jgi:hypothetical protein